MICSDFVDVFRPLPFLFFKIGLHLTSNTGYILRFPLTSTNPYKCPNAEHTTKRRLLGDDFTEKTVGMLLPLPISTPDIFSKLEIPRACAILRATSGFSQTTRV